MNVSLVVPSIDKDIPKLLSNLDLYFENLPVDKICVIGSCIVKDMLPKEDDRLSFILEEQLIDPQRVKDLIANRAGKEAVKRAGWYIQQFVKMQYSRICEDEYYLLWDSDTIPVKKIELFSEDGIPFLDCKTEYHKAYFDTMEKLFPGMKKNTDKSYISEHMLINSKLMRNMLDAIEAQESILGDTVDEKIINAINVEDVPKSGFSEFETYGTDVTSFYEKAYLIRDWHSMRYGAFFFDGSGALSSEQMQWISKAYDAISFEKGDYLAPISRMVRSRAYRKLFGARSLEFWSCIIRAFRKLRGKRSRG